MHTRASRIGFVVAAAAAASVEGAAVEAAQFRAGVTAGYSMLRYDERYSRGATSGRITAGRSFLFGSSVEVRRNNGSNGIGLFVAGGTYPQDAEFRRFCALTCREASGESVSFAALYDLQVWHAF